MIMNRSLKKDNKGASLIAVVIAMVFVVSIGVIIMNITLSNISMKEIELSSKKNFYSAEDVMETIKSSLTDKSAICLERAYVNILGRYAASIQSTNGGIQSCFRAAYLDELVNEYQKAGTITQWTKDESGEKFERSNIYAEGAFAMGYYDKALLTDNLSGDLLTLAQSSLVNLTDEKAQFEADYSAGTFTLKNIHVVFTDSVTGYETSIATDLIMTTPKLNFDGTNTVEEFMKYSIIADRQIYINGSPQIKGNAYSGWDGIRVIDGTPSFTGNTVVTRGTIDVSGATLTIGAPGVSENKVTNLWAENLRTSGASPIDPSVLDLYGNMYISDDLSLDGAYSQAHLHGNYYGYNFQKIYDSSYVNNVLKNQSAVPDIVEYERDASFSSAIVVNGRNAKLDMTGLKQLLLAGHAFISKGKLQSQRGNSDILTGESISVRTNQLEYCVPDDYLKVTKDSSAVSQNQVQSVRFLNEEELADIDENSDGLSGAAKFSKDLFGTPYSTVLSTPINEVPKIYDYIDEGDPFNVYYYLDGSDRVPRYYLKFKSIDAANRFFVDRVTVSSEGVNETIRKFLEGEAIKIATDPDRILTLSGSYMTVSPTDINVVPTGINSEEWTVSGNPDDELKTWAKFANFNAQTYKSLQLDLTTTNDTVNSQTIRFDDTISDTRGFVINNKEEDRLFENIIDPVVLDSFLSRYTDRKYDNGAVGTSNETAKVVVVDGNYEQQFTHGIIIATGDVTLNSGFHGMVIAGGTVNIAGGSYVADELMVSGLFEDDATRGLEATFTTIFPHYNNLASDVIGVVKVEDYIGYDNWTKYAE